MARVLYWKVLQQTYRAQQIFSTTDDLNGYRMTLKDLREFNVGYPLKAKINIVTTDD